MSDADYMEMVQKELRAVSRDVSQIVLTPVSTAFTGEPNVYRAQECESQSLSIYFDFGDYRLLVSSPESGLTKIVRRSCIPLPVL